MRRKRQRDNQQSRPKRKREKNGEAKETGNNRKDGLDSET